MSGVMLLLATLSAQRITIKDEISVFLTLSVIHYEGSTMEMQGSA